MRVVDEAHRRVLEKPTTRGWDSRRGVRAEHVKDEGQRASYPDRED
jgi:hypothetical protein